MGRLIPRSGSATPPLSHVILREPQRPTGFSPATAVSAQRLRAIPGIARGALPRLDPDRGSGRGLPPRGHCPGQRRHDRRSSHRRDAESPHHLGQRRRREPPRPRVRGHGAVRWGTAHPHLSPGSLRLFAPLRQLMVVSPSPAADPAERCGAVESPMRQCVIGDATGYDRKASRTGDRACGAKGRFEA